MPIPFIPLIIGGAVALSSAWGIKKGVDGASDIKKARSIAGNAERRGRSAAANLDGKRSEANKVADSYVNLLIRARTVTFARFVRFVESLGQRGSMEALEALEEVDVTGPQIREFKVAIIEPHSVATGAATIVGASSGASAGTTGLIGLLGTASTGTAISSLGGAAATNATLAWLGGGSLAAGGGGMALGSVMLGGIAVAPAILVGGFVLAGSGAKALTEAKSYDAKVSKEVANMGAMSDFLAQVVTRINEMRDLVSKLDTKVNGALDQLDSATFDTRNEWDVRRFQQAGLLMKALAEVMKTPVLDKDGEMTRESLKIQAKYKKVLG